MNSKDKGCRGERELATMLRAFGFGGAHRGQQFKGGVDSPDVVCFNDVHIECKRVEKLNIDVAMRQAIQDCGSKMPAVFHRRNRKPWLVTMQLKDWIEIYKRGRTQ